MPSEFQDSISRRKKLTDRCWSRLDDLVTASGVRDIRDFLSPGIGWWIDGLWRFDEEVDDLEAACFLSDDKVIIKNENECVRKCCLHKQFLCKLSMFWFVGSQKSSFIQDRQTNCGTRSRDKVGSSKIGISRVEIRVASSPRPRGSIFSPYPPPRAKRWKNSKIDDFFTFSAPPRRLIWSFKR